MIPVVTRVRGQYRDHQLASPERSFPHLAMTEPQENPRQSSVDYTETPLLMSAPTPGAGASDPQPSDEAFQQFFKRHYNKLERMFMSQFSARKSKHDSSSKGKAKRVLELSDDSSPDDTYYRDKTPDVPHTRRNRSRTPEHRVESPYIHHSHRGSLPRGTPFSGAVQPHQSSRYPPISSRMMALPTQMIILAPTTIP